MGTAAQTQKTPGAGRHRAFNLGGDLKLKALDITMSNSYATGGDTVSFDEFFITEVFGAIVAPSGGYVFDYDIANDTVIAYYGDYSNAADGVLVEVASTTDLSAVTTQVLAWGR